MVGGIWDCVLCCIPRVLCTEHHRLESCVREDSVLCCVPRVLYTEHHRLESRVREDSVLCCATCLVH